MIVMQILLENEVCQRGCLMKVSFNSVIYLKSQNFIFLTAWGWGKEKGGKKFCIYFSLYTFRSNNFKYYLFG